MQQMKASFQAKMAARFVRKRVRPQLADMQNIPKIRQVFNTPLPAAKGVRYSQETVGGVLGEWVDEAGARATATTILLYIHGGAFIGCSPVTHRPITAAFALQGLRVFVPDYRLAPEHPFPAAPDDVLAVYRALRNIYPNQRIVVAGDSAGGNLALGLLQTLLLNAEVLPAAAALFSPATDMLRESPSRQMNAQRDAMFDPQQLALLREPYLAGADPSQYLASPLNGPMQGLPPLMIHVGETEVLRDDSIRLTQKAREAGVRVDLEIFPVVHHVWQMVHQLPEAKRSIRAAATFLKTVEPSDAIEELDVLIVGAGLSGIGAAVHLLRDCPEKSFTILEARTKIGGTWDLFRYPGIRSDSDMYTLGYEFKPWKSAKAIADGPAIRQYIDETMHEYGLAAHIRTQHRVLQANWSSEEGRWLVDIERGPTQEIIQIKVRFLLFCSGYYNYAQAHAPLFPGADQFTGSIIHPQFWPEHFDYAGKQIVVIGSGATAVTLVPEMAKTAAHVTMLQRSPSYVVARPATDQLAERIKQYLPEGIAYQLIRMKNVFISTFLFQRLRKYPQQAKKYLIHLTQKQLGNDFDVQTHFSPNYNPWDQRLCLVPDGDLFVALREGKASIATDQIDRFVPEGIALKSGKVLPADVIVTATGLQLSLFGEVKLTLDGKSIDPHHLFVYKGMMYSGIPNMANTMGYTNASWTLKADLTSRYFCRLLNHLDHTGQTVFTPTPDASLLPQPYLDFTSGYIQRVAHLLPQQGDRKPWRLNQNYALDLLALRFGKLQDGVMTFS